MNLARNIGGSVGISLVTTILARRAQFHHARLTEQAGLWNRVFNQAITSAGRLFGGAPSAGSGPYALVNRTIEQQANTLSYIDCFFVLSVAFALMVPLVFLMKRARPGRAIAAH